MATDEQVEFLVGAAQFQIAFECYRVIALHQRVQKFVHADRQAFFEALGKVVALHHAGYVVFARQLNHAARPQGVAPLAVVANLCFVHIDDQTELVEISFGVFSDLLGSQGRACAVAARRVAN